ncbi:hypothetical protein NA57DRAFT_56054 [Rhizodiscina lignyota]|uniref:Uncharacterized protein n=1 Tax=Rhizodiscina lignyota TaxID=1504668 RepID=A0A9P4IL32_9PEZI|nr:hypothetical protein NA57DRAFT_56054 [Rhizodiscina lignyota]
MNGIDDKRPNVDAYEMSTRDASWAEKASSESPINEQQAYNIPRRRDLWLWEIVGVVGSAAALAGIIGILAALNGKPLPTWSQPHQYCGNVKGKDYCGHVTVSVNSVIAWLSTIGKLCVLIPISRSLGQLKWIYFTQDERSLADLDKFDSAARGLTGSLKLAWSLKGKHFAIVGAIAMVLSLGFDPFIQNLVAYDLRYPVSQNAGYAYVANTTKYNPETFSVHADATVDVSMKANILSSLFNANDDWKVAKYSCPTGNCTWDAYSSLGVCAQCTDLTHRLKRSCADFNNVNASTWCDAWLPNGFTLRRQDNPHNLNVMRIGSPTEPVVEAYQELVLNRPMAIVDSISAFGSHLVNSTTKLVASECALTPCVRIYNTSIGSSSRSTQAALSGAQYYEQTISSPFTGYIVDEDTQDSIVPMSIVPSLGIYSENYTIPYNINHGISFYLASILSGNVGTEGDDDYEYQSEEAGIETQNGDLTADLMQAIFLGNYSTCETPQNGNICAMQNLALGMTKAIRDSSWNLDTAKPVMAKGHVLAPVTYVVVSWVWICLPVLIWLLGLVFLVGTVIETKRAGLFAWGLNPLPVIFLGFDAKARENINAEHGMSEKGLTKKAEELKVRLRINHNEAVMTST